MFPNAVEILDHATHNLSGLSLLFGQTLFFGQAGRCTFSSCKAVHLRAVTGMGKDEPAKAPRTGCDKILLRAFMGRGGSNPYDDLYPVFSLYNMRVKSTVNHHLNHQLLLSSSNSIGITYKRRGQSCFTEPFSVSCSLHQYRHCTLIFSGLSDQGNKAPTSLSILQHVRQRRGYYTASAFQC